MKAKNVLVGRMALLLAALIAPGHGWAQAPAWAAVAAGSNQQTNCANGISAMTTDASGNVFVTGFFIGTVAFGSTVLTCAGDLDLFVAKYVPATGTWAWAVSGGGTGQDQGMAIAVSGNNVYVTGLLENNLTNGGGVLFGGTGTTPGTMPQYGASVYYGNDLVLVKYIDNGSSATLAWTQVGGGGSYDEGTGVAVSGNSVYVTGNITNSAADINRVRFGGTGARSGTTQVNGASGASSLDLLVAKYVDNGNSATLAWTQVGGGIYNDEGRDIAVNGTNVYVTGAITNTAANVSGVLFGGAGTTPGTAQVNGASNTNAADVLLVKYVDNGPDATLAWTQVGGGTGSEEGIGVAVSGTNVYVVGGITNTAANGQNVVFGGTGTVPGTVPVSGASPARSADLLVAKYIDNGPDATLAWTQVGGGTRDEYGIGVAVSGNSVYVTGAIQNDAANSQGVVFGGNGTVPGTVSVNGASTTNSADVVVAKYTDNGPSATLNWTQVGGGPNGDGGSSVAISGGTLCVAGGVNPVATFGPFAIAGPSGYSTGFVGLLRDPTLATAAPTATPFTLSPNPARTACTVQGTPANATLTVCDALGRPITTATADATGTARLALPAGLPPGVYVVRGGGRARRLAVE